jgi:bacterioferritin
VQHLPQPVHAKRKVDNGNFIGSILTRIIRTLAENSIGLALTFAYDASIVTGQESPRNRQEHTMTQPTPFLTDIQTLRKRAREHIEQGAITPGYRGDRETAIKLLNDALATEIVCVLRYKRHYFMASGIHAQSVAAEFLEHANEEQGHADQIAERIVQLGGDPNFSPEGILSRSHAEYVEGDSLVSMIKEDLIAERIAIDSYREMITYFGNNDPTSRRLMEEILAVEEEHADDLVSLLEELR